MKHKGYYLKGCFGILFLLLFNGFYTVVQAQGVHFSQYNNAPLLISPANAGLMPDDDFRAGAIYRNQWSQVPVPYNTFSAFSDFQLLHGRDHSNWLGLGGAFYSDRAGSGDLSLTGVQLNVAYHLRLGDYNMLSGGLGFGYMQRSIDFSKLTFDAQWDGFSFDRNLAAQENYTVQKTAYPDISVGLNYSFFPNENAYFLLGLGLTHINQPVESFYGVDNRIAMRPLANANMMFMLSSAWIAEFSAHYTNQRGASEMLFGTQFSYNVTPTAEPVVFILGSYYRLGDAVIPLVGVDWKSIRFQATMDVTTSGLSMANKGNGGFEFSIIYRGGYGSGGRRDIGGYTCPRF